MTSHRRIGDFDAISNHGSDTDSLLDSLQIAENFISTMSSGNVTPVTTMPAEDVAQTTATPLEGRILRAVPQHNRLQPDDDESTAILRALVGKSR